MSKFYLTVEMVKIIIGEMNRRTTAVDNQDFKKNSFLYKVPILQAGTYSNKQICPMSPNLLIQFIKTDVEQSWMDRMCEY